MRGSWPQREKRQGEWQIVRVPLEGGAVTSLSDTRKLPRKPQKIYVTSPIDLFDITVSKIYIEAMPSSKYPMVPVDEALGIVLAEAMKKFASDKDIALTPLTKARGLVLAEDVTAKIAIPSFRTSILDGFAVSAPMTAGSYPIQSRVHAGAADILPLQSGSVQYITTGGAVPPGANAVLRVEDTDVAPSDPDRVAIRVDVPAGTSNIREVGSDISADQQVLAAGRKVGAAEIGILCSIGVTEVRCYRPPVVGVMSTGDELVNAWEAPSGTQIRDSNRAAIIAALEEVICRALLRFHGFSQYFDSYRMDFAVLT